MIVSIVSGASWGFVTRAVDSSGDLHVSYYRAHLFLLRVLVHDKINVCFLRVYLFFLVRCSLALDAVGDFLRRGRPAVGQRFDVSAQKPRVRCDLIFGKGSVDFLQTWNIGERRDNEFWKGLTPEVPPSTIWAAIRGSISGAEDDKSEQIWFKVHTYVCVLYVPKNDHTYSVLMIVFGNS